MLLKSIEFIARECAGNFFMIVPLFTSRKRMFPSSSPSVKREASGFDVRTVAGGLLSDKVFASLKSWAGEDRETKRKRRKEKLFSDMECAKDRRRQKPNRAT